MSAIMAASDGNKPPGSNDASNFNVSFNGNKNGPGFAIYIVPSGPPNEAQNNAKKEGETTEENTTEKRHTQVQSESELKIQQTFGNYSLGGVSNQTTSHLKNPITSFVKPVQKDTAACHKVLPSHAYDKGISSHWKEVKMFRPEKEDVYNWSRSATSKLLELYTSEKYFDRFRDRFTKKKVLWNEIADYLNREGYTVGVPLTGEQCANKFRNLKKVYMKCQNQNLSISESIRRFEYFTQLHHILSESNDRIPSSSYSHDGRIHHEPNTRKDVPTNELQYSGHYSPPYGHDVTAQKNMTSDVMDLSHSPVDTKPLILETYSADQIRHGSLSSSITASTMTVSNAFPTHSMASEYPGPVDNGRRDQTEAMSNAERIGSNKRKASGQFEQDEPPKIFCLNESEDDFEEDAINASAGNDTRTRTDSRLDVAPFDDQRARTPGDAVETLIKKHLENRNRAFSNLIKSLVELHEEESKLLSTILHLIERNDR